MKLTTILTIDDHPPALIHPKPSQPGVLSQRGSQNIYMLGMHDNMYYNVFLTFSSPKQNIKTSYVINSKFHGWGEKEIPKHLQLWNNTPTNHTNLQNAKNIESNKLFFFRKAVSSIFT